MEPLADLTMIRPKSSGVLRRSFTITAADWSVPSISPVAWVTLLAAMARRRASRSTPADFAAAGFTVTRMAGCSAPAMMTWATPRTWAMDEASPFERVRTLDPAPTPGEAERVLAGFPYDRADEGPTAGPASLAGLRIARENGWTAGTESSRTGSSQTELSKGDHA